MLRTVLTEQKLFLALKIKTTDTLPILKLVMG